MNPLPSSGHSLHRDAIRKIGRNAVLVMLLVGVFLWSVAGNAIEQIRAAIEKH